MPCNPCPVAKTPAAAPQLRRRPIACRLPRTLGCRFDKEVLGGRLWHPACQTAANDIKDQIPLSFPSRECCRATEPAAGACASRSAAAPRPPACRPQAVHTSFSLRHAPSAWLGALGSRPAARAAARLACVLPPSAQRCRSLVALVQPVSSCTAPPAPAVPPVPQWTSTSAPLSRWCWRRRGRGCGLTGQRGAQRGAPGRWRWSGGRERECDMRVCLNWKQGKGLTRR